jgi:hypothetical protein
MTTLLPIFAHSARISGPIDSKLSANERELILDKIRESSNFFVQTTASSLSEQLRQ